MKNSDFDHLFSTDGIDADPVCTVDKDTMDSGLEEMEDRAVKIYKLKVAAVINKIEEIGLPKPNEQIRIITRRTFNAAAFLEHICKTHTIDDLKLVVYSINHEAAESICRLLDSGKIKKTEILISNLRNKAHRTKEQLTRDLFVNHPNVDLFFCSSHAKVMSAKVDGGEAYYTIEGSGNLSWNSRVEQYVIDNDKTLYDFTCSWMREIREFLRGRKELIET